MSTLYLKNISNPPLVDRGQHLGSRNGHPDAIRRILVIDDTRAIHDDFRKILDNRGGESAQLDESEVAVFGEAPTRPNQRQFIIDSAYQGNEAVESVERGLKEGCRYEVAFVDVRMPPGWDGIETTSRLWALDPDLQVVLCTAYSDYSWAETIAKVGGSDRLLILKKPFDTVEVLQLANTLSEKWRLLQKSRAKMGELEHRVTERTQELQAANAKLLTEMAERARVEEALRQAQKMEAVGQLAAGVAHDFNNILTVILGHVGLVLAGENLEPETEESLRQVAGAAERAAGLTRQLLAFSRKQVMQSKVIDLNQVIRNLEKMLHRLVGEQVKLECHYSEPIPSIYADASNLEQILMNLTVNARDAMPHGVSSIATASVAIDSEYVTNNPGAKPGRYIRLNVTDTGCGMPAIVLSRVFEPFYTTKEVGKGTGLGLSTVYGIVKQHGGWIEVASEVSRGSTFAVFIPCTDKLTRAGDTVRVAPKADGGKETVLLVEDEAPLRQLARKVLNARGYNVLEAGTGNEALEVWRQQEGKVDLLLTDMVMPDGMSGRKLVEKLQAMKTDLKVIYSSGYSLELVDGEVASQAGFNFLPKPYSPTQLVESVRNCLDGVVVGSKKNGLLQPA